MLPTLGLEFALPWQVLTVSIHAWHTQMVGEIKKTSYTPRLELGTELLCRREGSL